MIQGLAERVRVVELGKIKIGGKSAPQEGRDWRTPQKWDHFGITTLERDAAGDLKLDMKLMTALALEQKCEPLKIKEIPIALLSDEIEDVFPTSYVAYMGKVCVGRSDGETITWFADPTNSWAPLKEPVVRENKNKYVETATYKDKKGNELRLFKPHGTLNCVIASADARWGGVYKLRTTSIITIEQIYSGLVQVQQLTRGFLRNVPLRLVMRPMQVSPNGVATTVYVIHVELRGADLNAVQQKVIEAAQLEITTGKALLATRSEFQKLLRAPGEDESEEEQEDVATEFHAEAVGVEVPAAKPVVAPAAAVDNDHAMEAMRAARSREELDAAFAQSDKGKSASAVYGAVLDALSPPAAETPPTKARKPPSVPRAPKPDVVIPAPVEAATQSAKAADLF